MSLLVMFVWVFLMVNKQKYTDQVLKENWDELPKTVQENIIGLSKRENYGCIAVFIALVFDVIVRLTGGA